MSSNDIATQPIQALIERWRRHNLCRLDAPANAIIRACPHCDFSGSSRRDVFRHAVKAHPATVQLRCPICFNGVSLTGVDAYVQHMGEFHVEAPDRAFEDGNSRS
jgi:hypothetical protein